MEKPSLGQNTERPVVPPERLPAGFRRPTVLWLFQR